MYWTLFLPKMKNWAEAEVVKIRKMRRYLMNRMCMIMEIVQVSGFRSTFIEREII
ncbi:MAG: hypothetical protein QME52_05450 [Bacteroidota bacterium]|nr:hypothetical protein [Bacteroidota bacterium]